MRRALFLLSKDPAAGGGGDSRLTLMVMAAARTAYEVRAIALDPAALVPAGGSPANDGSAIQIERVKKLRPTAGIARGLLYSARRSLLHARFDSPLLRQAVESAHNELLVAEHTYMAESASRALTQHECAERLYVNTHVSEASVYASRGLPWSVQASVVREDEQRIVKLARSTAYFDSSDVRDFRRATREGPDDHVLDVTLPSTERIRVEDQPQRLIFLGDRRWPPNQEAFRRLVRLWPRIRLKCPNAELIIVGRRLGRRVQVAPGMRDLGFVASLDDVMNGCRGLIAPISTGGGVRVKVLEAARAGLPVISTSEGLGDLSQKLLVEPCHNDDELIDRALQLLTSRAFARADSLKLWDRNNERWRSDSFANSIADWLA